jgi:hypothetical protein
MSSRPLNFIRTFIVLCSFMLALGYGAPVMAQTGGVASKPITQFPIYGSESVLVDGDGYLVANPAMGGSHQCPFDVYNISVYAAASGAAKTASDPDPDGCPFATGNNGEHIYLQCGFWYRTMSVLSKTYPNFNLDCCDIAPGIVRDMCHNRLNKGKKRLGAFQANYMVKTQTIPNDPDILSSDEINNINAAIATKKQTSDQCFNGVLESIGKYWGSRREVKCVKDITKFFGKQAWKASQKQIDDMTKATQIGSSATGTAGAMTAVAPVPSPYGLAATLVSFVKTNAQTIATILKIGSELSSALNDCSSIVPGLASANAFQNSLASQLSCKALNNLIIRQLTQCIRVNLTVDVKLPQFSLLAQCPVQLNVSAQLGPDGFKCYSSATAQSPVSSSLLGNSGGLANLFNGDCFGGGTTTAASNGTDSTGGAAGTRTPGVDCGPLDTGTTLKNQPLNGANYLAAGSATDGWAVGGSETLPMVPQMTTDSKGNTVPAVDANGNAILVPGNPSITVTRCDLYASQRLMRTTYVYGSGASCNTGANGFLDGGFETNTSCYNNNYTPLAAPNIPDACMYPATCLDSNGNFSQALAGAGGSSGCPAGVTPVFNPNATYMVFTSGGVGGGNQTPQSCSQFSAGYQQPIICCDPQKQDCTKKDANVPLCVCDQGDASNTLNTVPGANGALVPDPAGSCTEGGEVTCCSPRLNGADWCNANMGANSICADEKADVCVGSGTPATYTDPSGHQSNVTAADIILSQPSPYIYLFVRPDAQLNGQACCMTEWCNICPQEYANAYGLSLIRSNMAQSTSDAGNAALMGKGWPFSSNTDANGAVSYQVPSPISYQINWTIAGASDQLLTIHPQYPTLFMSNNINTKPLADAIESCNNLAGGHWKTGYTDKQMDGDLGFVYDYWQGETINGRSEVHTISGIPSVSETPLAYMNRMAGTTTDNSGSPPPTIPLCSDVAKLCPNNSDSSVLNTVTPSTVVNQPPSNVPPVPLTPVAPVTPVVTTPVVTPAPVTTAPAASNGKLLPTPSTQPSLVPSATGQAPNTLY